MDFIVTQETQVVPPTIKCHNWGKMASSHSWSNKRRSRTNIQRVARPAALSTQTNWTNISALYKTKIQSTYNMLKGDLDATLSSTFPSIHQLRLVLNRSTWFGWLLPLLQMHGEQCSCSPTLQKRRNLLCKLIRSFCPITTPIYMILTTIWQQTWLEVLQIHTSTMYCSKLIMCLWQIMLIMINLDLREI